MSRCREPARQTSTGGFHKESLSIHPLIPLARGLAIVTFHAQFQLVLAAFVPVAERRGVPFQGNIFGYLGEDEIKARAIAPADQRRRVPGTRKALIGRGGQSSLWMSGCLLLGGAAPVTLVHLTLQPCLSGNYGPQMVL